MKCMHMISRDREYSEGRGVGVNCRQHVVYILNCYAEAEPQGDCLRKVE